MIGARLLTLGLLAVTALLLLSALPLAPPARRVPVFLLVPTLAALVIQAFLELRRRRGAPGRRWRPWPAMQAAWSARASPPASADGGSQAPWRAIAAILAAALATDLAGVALALPAVLLAWLTCWSRLPLWQAALAALAAWLVLRLGLAELLGLYLPPGRLLLLL